MRQVNSYFLRFLVSSALIIISGFLKAQDNQGFFLDDWQPKSIVSPSYTDTTEVIGTTGTHVTIDFNDKVAKVSKYVYGNNSNPYSGQLNYDVTLVNYIKDLNPHVIRWPGGNISQVYYWDRSTKPTDISSTEFWGGKGVSHTNDDYLDLLKKTNCTGSICVNIGYARYGTSDNPIQTAAHYAANWVRYDKGRTKFWELGNENYGSWEAGYKIDVTKNKDNQPELINGYLYGKICSVFIDSMRQAASEVGADIKIGAVSVEANITYDTIQMNWNKGMMSVIANKVDFYIVHSYYTPYNENSPVSTILNSPVNTKGYADYINSCLASVGHGPMPIALTEWNIFAINSKQAVSYINGMQTAINLGELIKNKFGMANKWNLSNGWSNGDDHGMFASSSEGDVTFRTPHPQFHYMYFFQKYFGDQMVKSTVTGNSNIMAYASSFASGHCGLVLANKSRNTEQVVLDIKNFKVGKHAYFHILTGGTDNGDFSRKVFINGRGPTEVAGGPANYNTIKPYGLATDDSLRISMPPLSIVYMLINPANIPDIESAKITEANTIKVKLTRAVALPVTLKGLKVVLNGSVNDSITKIEKDAVDSTLLLLTLNNAVMNNDKIKITYNSGNLMSWDSIPMVEVPGFKVENLLPGSKPEVTGASTEKTENNTILISFNKKIKTISSSSFSVKYNYIGDHNLSVTSGVFANTDSTTFKLTLSEPLYQDYKISLSYAGIDVTSADGGKLDAITSLLVSNYGAPKPATIQQAYTSVKGDSIFLVFDKNLISTSILKPAFKITLNGNEVTIKTISIWSKSTKTIVIKTTPAVGLWVGSIKASYSGGVLISSDNAVASAFTDRDVENKSTNGIADLTTVPLGLYPNPVKDKLTISTKFQYKEIEIVEMTGKIAFLKKNNQSFPETNNISLHLSKGMYLLILKGSNSHITSKLLVE